MNALPRNHDHPFEAEMERAQVPVLGYLVRLTGNLADARDLLQVTNLTAWEKRETFEEGTNAIAWMRAIARNHYRNSSRREQTRKTVPLLDHDLEQMVEARHEEREQEDTRKRRLLHFCLEKLPDRQRDAVEGYYLSGHSLEELGSENGRKANAMAQLLHRARQNLVDCVKRESHRQMDQDNFSDFS
ncbi:MAG: sigma-70 family RNA polymerase sigma factor [Verrucomicrobiota bacterium]